MEEFEGGRLPTTCGCHLRSPSTGENSTLYVFVSDYTPEKSRRAWVEVDGALKTLRLVSSTEKQGESHKGDSYTEDYRAGDTKVSVRFVVVTPFFPTVEVAEFSAAITVMKGGRSATVEAVGECGCG